MKKTLIAVLFTLTTFSSLMGDPYTAIPFKAYAESRKKVFSFFDNLERYEAYILGEDEQYLGMISRSAYGMYSINNSWGSHGSSYGSCSIFNSSSRYGTRFSEFSAFNPYAACPPTIRYKEGGVEYVAGYLTRNIHFIGEFEVANIDPSCLWDWLKAEESFY